MRSFLEVTYRLQVAEALQRRHVQGRKCSAVRGEEVGGTGRGLACGGRGERTCGEGSGGVHVEIMFFLLFLNGVVVRRNETLY